MAIKDKLEVNNRKVITHIDISNLVHRSISAYFDNNRPEIQKLKSMKESKEITASEYSKRKEAMLEEIVRIEGDTLQYLNLSKSYTSIMKSGSQHQSKDDAIYCYFDSHTWRKKVVEDFYFNNEDAKEKMLYKDGRTTFYKGFVRDTINNLFNLLNDLNMNKFKYKTLEADDLIAKVVELHPDENILNVIQSNDIDFFQSQKEQENVIQYSNNKKAYYDFLPDEAKAELLLKTITGDSSDNIPKITNFKFNIDELGDEVKPLQLGKLTSDFIKLYGVQSREEILHQIANRLFMKQLERKKDKKDDTKTDYRINKDGEKKFINLKPVVLTTLKKDMDADYSLDIEKQLFEIAKLKKETKKIIHLSEYEGNIDDIPDDTFIIYKTFEEIKKQLTKNFNHNDNIISFENIPEEYVKEFMDGINLKDGKYIPNEPKKGLAKSEIYRKYNLFNLSVKNDQYFNTSTSTDENIQIEKDIKSRIESQANTAKPVYQSIIDGSYFEENNKKHINESPTINDAPAPNSEELPNSDIEPIEEVEKTMITVEYAQKFARIIGLKDEIVIKYLNSLKKEHAFRYREEDDSWIMQVKGSEKYPQTTADSNIKIINRIINSIDTSKHNLEIINPPYKTSEETEKKKDEILKKGRNSIQR